MVRKSLWFGSPDLQVAQITPVLLITPWKKKIIELKKDLGFEKFEKQKFTKAADEAQRTIDDLREYNGGQNNWDKSNFTT